MATRDPVDETMSGLQETNTNDEGYVDESENGSEYTYTDCSESEDSSGDSGRGSMGGRNSNFSKKNKKTVVEDCPYSTIQVEDFSNEELEVSKNFAEWTKQIMDPTSNIVKELQKEFCEYLPKFNAFANNAKTENHKIVTLIGGKDEAGNIHGEAEIYYDNGDYFWGDFNHGAKEGPASIVLKNGDNYMGEFKNNQLEGFVTEHIAFCDRDNVTREVFYRKGVRHGFYREIGPLKQFWAIGRFANGKKIGSHWRWAKGNSFLVGAIDEGNKPHGDFNIYLYPDLKTALVGNFDHGKMKTGHMVQLNSFRREFGIPIPQYSEKIETQGFPNYTFDQSTRLCISKNPFLRDPYEKRYVYVKESQVPLAGEGLWAKTDIKAGQLVALFNGVRQRHLWGVMSHELAWSDYRINCEKEVDLDILDEHIPIENYRATLGHKACHSFNNNASFAQLWHPRFGLIMSVVAKEDILAGEEVFVTYNYTIAKSPEWYRLQWFNHLREELEWSEQKIYSWSLKEYRKSGLSVEIPPPSRDSDRFLPCGGCKNHVSQDDASISCSSCLVWHHMDCSGLEEDTFNREDSIAEWVGPCCG